MNGLLPFVSPENSAQSFDSDEPPDAVAGRLELAIAGGPADGSLAGMLTSLAAVRLGQGRHDEAVRLARQLVALDPTDRQARGLIGVALAESGAAREAVLYLGFAPDLPPFHIAKALALTALGSFDEAEASARKAALQAPDDPEPFRALGAALACQRRYADALLAFGQALAVDPDHAESHLGRARVRLALGDESAWHEAEWRTRTPAYAAAVATNLPPWDGASSAGLNLLLVAEPADEDTIFFARYIQDLHDSGVNITLACAGTLGKLLSRAPGVDRVVPPGELPRDLDAYAFLGSLPSLLPAARHAGQAAPFLPADTTTRVPALDRLTGLKVAVHWRARPDDRRSFPLLALKPLAEVEGVRLVSVQEGGSDEAFETAVPLLDVGAQDAEGPTDYEALAAVLRGVDLVVTNDGPVAHLAGALGVPAWVALPVGPEWPWAGDREDSPWYPSLRLFRQRRTDDWSDVFRLMETELKVELAARHAARIGAVPTPWPDADEAV